MGVDVGGIGDGVIVGGKEVGVRVGGMGVDVGAQPLTKTTRRTNERKTDPIVIFMVVSPINSIVKSSRLDVYYTDYQANEIM